MKNSILILFLGVVSCNNIEDKTITIPRSYSIFMTWGTYWDNQNIHKLIYMGTQDSLSILTQNSNDSISSFSKYKIEKINADSIFILAYQNNKNFNILDTNYLGMTDGDNISITVYSNNQSFTNSYISQASHSSASDKISNIISIIKNVTKDTTLFN
jgi:hypothetical protein